MAIIALVSNKGGVGKTTLCVNVASALSRQVPTLLLDADPQGSSLQWREIAEYSTGKNAPPVSVLSASRGLAKVVEEQRHAVEAEGGHLVIDCPPSVHSAQTRQALSVCDIALIPIQPSPLDLWASVHIEDEVAKARKNNPELQAWLVINQMEPRTRLSQIMSRALAELSLPAAETAIRRRVAYRNCVLEGRSVLDLGKRGAAAAEEIEQLIREVEIGS